MMKKVTFYSDEEVWKKFSSKILEEENSTRKISEKLQNLIEDYLLENFFNELLNSFNIQITNLLSSNEIKTNRPTVNLSSAEIIREGRDLR
jgi:hypothetical protein